MPSRHGWRTLEMATVVVLHGSWVDGALHLWAERWSAELASMHARAASAAGDTHPLFSPYDPGAQALEAALAAVPGTSCDGDVAVRIAWLPTHNNRPVHSREVWRFANGATAQRGRATTRDAHAQTRAAAPAPLPRARVAALAGLELAPWQVSVLPLAGRALFSLLGACRDDRRLAAGVMAGPDLLIWAELFRYAGALVARAAFLPALVRCGLRYESRWLPAFDGGDRRRLFHLAAQLPPAASCLAGEGVPFRAAPATETAAAFVDEAVDQLVRFSAVTTLSRAHASKGRYFSAHDAWLAALRGDGREVRWDNDSELVALASEIEGWRRPVDLASRADWRLLLRLEEPAKDAAPSHWFLRYLMQPLSHPDAVQPLAAVWHGSGAVAAERGELALTSLGQASTLCPLLTRGEGAQATTGCLLTTGEAHEFLTVYAPLLTAAGFGVDTPTWWQGANNRPRMELIARAVSGEASDARPCSLASLVSVDWQMALGGEAATIEEIEKLAQSGEKLVQFRDRWIEFDTRQVDEALRLWRRRKAEARSAGDIVRMMIGMDQEAHGLRVGGVQAHGWIQELADRLRGETAIAELETPQGFHGELRPYQRSGYAWLAFLRGWKLGACLADDMGLGKTIQTLALLAREQERGEKRPVLLVCPSSVIGNWQRETARFTPGIRVLRHHGPERSLGEDFVAEANRHTLVVTNYALLPRDYATLRRVAWAGVVLDEAQNIKNPDTRQSQAARALSADYRLALTGTPVENHVGDLWSIMDFLNPGLLGTRAAFRERFLRPIQSGADPTGRERLRRATKPFVLRRLKTDRTIIADLPEKIEGRVYCPLTREQATLYAAVLHELETALTHATGIARRGLVLATLTRLKQICNHPVNYMGETAPAGKLQEKRLAAARASSTASAKCSRRWSPAMNGPWCLRSLRAWARCCSSTSGSSSASSRCFCMAACRCRSAIAWWKRFNPGPDRRCSYFPCGPAGPGSTSPAPTTFFITTAGGIRPWKIRPPTAPSGSGRRAMSWCTNSSAPVRSRIGLTP